MASRHPRLLGTSLLILAAVTLYACNDFLTKAAAPEGTLNEQTLMTLSGVEGTLMGAYRTLDCTNAISGNWGCAASDWVWGSVASDDAYKGSTADDQSPINDILARHWGTGIAEGYLEVKWQITYEGITRANSTIRLLKEVRAANPSAIPDADARGIEGEAIFLRAYYHFEAWKMWGSIPYYREDDANYRKANIDTSQVVTELLKDLDSAIVLLPPTPRNGDLGRASQWTAKAYKGRVQMYNHDYAGAIATLEDVKNNGPYALETSFDHVWTGFTQYANGKETIWAYQASANDGEPNGANANFGERLNFPYSGSHFGCCGFHAPSFNLVNFYQVDVNGLPLALSQPDTWNASDANFTAGNLTPVDPRLDWTVGRSQVPFKDWGVVKVTNGADTWVRSISDQGPYTPKKNIHEAASGAESAVGWTATQLNSVNIHIFRYADMLLLLAEAYVEQGRLPDALTIVNQIRARAGVTAQGCGFTSTNGVQTAYAQCNGDARIAVPINDSSITWAVYRVGLYPSFPSPAYARAAVQTERRLELALEGQRFFDLRRWGIAASVMNGYDGPGSPSVGGGIESNRLVFLQTAEAYTSRHRWYPLPSIEIELSKVGSESPLKQNPGW